MTYYKYFHLCNNLLILVPQIFLREYYFYGIFMAKSISVEKKGDSLYELMNISNIYFKSVSD